VLHRLTSADGCGREAACAARSLLEYALDREIALADFADQMLINYEELNMLYALLPSIATKINEQEIGRVLVEQAAEILGCDRVSLLMVEEGEEYLRVLASRGLPKEATRVRIPIAESVAGRVLSQGQPYAIEDICQRPDLAECSLGTYSSNTFAVVRVPMRARGRPVGMLTATERRLPGEFAARDFKLLEGLSAMGAASLMHCRLHAAVHRQMIGTIQALAAAVDAKDRYTHDHSSRVSQLCIATAHRMGEEDNEVIRQIELAGLLHDIGKIGIPDAILSKPDRLTDDEIDAIRQHTRIGATIVRQVKGLEQVAEAILCHHERWDGLGYPTGLSGEEIPFISRLIAVADTFDSITSNRSYRSKASEAAAMAEIEAGKEFQFDPRVVEALREVVDAEVAVLEPVGA
jgi:putative nucleotidyltransferase with HDIG domain